MVKQNRPPRFEVIVVDDGSENPVPGELVNGYAYPLRIIHQVALGISAARNCGMRRSDGQVILFLDSDVSLDRDFLANLARYIDGYPHEFAFQANLQSGTSNLVERMENLRLSATIASLTDGEGRVSYVNTSAFAICRRALPEGRDLFDPGCVRGEDTMLLAGLVRQGWKPRLVTCATAFHRPQMGLRRYILKHLLIGYHTTPARDELRRACPGTLLTRSGKRGMARHMVQLALENKIDLVAFSLVAAAHGFEIIGRLVHRVAGFRQRRNQVLHLPVDGVRDKELVAKIISCLERNNSLLVTYLTAWSLVQACNDPSMIESIRNFDICYPDGIGVVYTSLLLGGGRIRKVTANNFFHKLVRQVELMKWSVAFVGAKPHVIFEAVRRIHSEFPGINMVGYSDGYFLQDKLETLSARISKWNPQLVIVGMGQPLQEKLALECSRMLPHTVFLCVGGLFDYICGDKPTPPRWIRKAGFEWLYILILRPRRFWKRYLLGIPKLVILIIQAWFSKILHTTRQFFRLRSL